MTKKIKFFGFAALALTAALTTSCQSDENVNVEEKMVAMDVELSSLTTTETDSPLTRASVEKRKIQYFFCDANNNILTTDSKDGVPYAGCITDVEGFNVYLPAGKNVVAKFAHMSSSDVT